VCVFTFLLGYNWEKYIHVYHVIHIFIVLGIVLLRYSAISCHKS